MENRGNEWKNGIKRNNATDRLNKHYTKKGLGIHKMGWSLSRNQGKWEKGSKIESPYWLLSAPVLGKKSGGLGETPDYVSYFIDVLFFDALNFERRNIT